ncbi:IclR family transcriptional regulator [Arthrobacter sp. D1-29]
MTEKSPVGVQAVGRVFELLELIENLGGAATLSELSSSTHIPPPSIHRHLRTLVTLGCIRQLPNRRYALGPRLITLGDGAIKQLGALALPQLKTLVDQLGESAKMAVLDVDMVVYVAQVPSLHSMRTSTEVGRRAHTHTTGIGKAILAQLSEDTVQQILMRAGMPTPTARSISGASDLLADLRLIRERGFSVDEQEQEIGVRCFAVAVPDAPTPTAISVSGPVSRLDEHFASRAVPILTKAAQTISEKLQ